MISDVNARRPLDAIAKSCAFHGVEYIQYDIPVGRPEAELMCPVAPQPLIDQFSDTHPDGHVVSINDNLNHEDDRPHDEECYSWWYH